MIFVGTNMSRSQCCYIGFSRMSRTVLRRLAAMEKSLLRKQHGQVNRQLSAIRNMVR